MYNPKLGIFQSHDPLGYIDSMNMYACCGNNPTNFVDPWGEDVWISHHYFGGWHANINVGDINGDYDSYGYRLVDSGGNSLWNNWFNPCSPDFRRGEVYSNGYKNGKPVRRINTTPDQDKCIKEQLDNLKGQKGPYDFYRTCHQFANVIFEAILEAHGLVEQKQRWNYPKADHIGVVDPSDIPIDLWR